MRSSSLGRVILAGALLSGAVVTADDAQLTATVTARVHRPDGTPSSGVTWLIEGREPGATGTALWTRGVAWEDVRGSTDDGGVVVASFDPPAGYSFELVLNGDGLAETRWSLGLIKTGRALDLGDLQLVAAGKIMGRVLDDRGLPMAAGWEVWIDEQGAEPGDPPARMLASSRARPTGNEGTFAYTAVRPGHYRTRLHVRAAGWVDGPGVSVVAGVTAYVELRFSGVKLHQRVFLEPRLAGGGPLVRPPLEAIVLRGFGLAPRAASKIPGRIGLSFDDVPPGSYTLTIDGPGLAPFRLDGVSPGPAPLDVRLIGLGSLVLSVTDAATGLPIERFAVSATAKVPRHTADGVLPGATSSRRDLSQLAVHAGGVARFNGLQGTPHDVTVSAPGYQPATEPWDGGPLAGLGTLAVAMEPVASVAGIVVNAAGRPLADVAVGLFDAPREVNDGPVVYLSQADYWDVWPLPGNRREERMVTSTDDSGRFLFRDAPSGTFAVRAYRTAELGVASDDLVLEPSTKIKGLRLVMQDGHFVEGRIVTPPGALCEGMSVLAVRQQGDLSDAIPLKASVSSTGEFRLGPLGSGRVELQLQVTPDWLATVFVAQPTQDESPFVLGTVEVGTEQDTNVEFDLGASFPGRIVVDILVNGEPAQGAWAQLIALDGSGRQLAVAQAGDDGVAVLGPLPACSGRVRISERDSTWITTLPEDVVVPPGDTNELELDLSVAEGQLLLVSAQTGQALADEIVCIYLSLGDGWSASPRRVDDGGRLSLTLPASELRILLLGSDAAWVLPPDEPEGAGERMNRQMRMMMTPAYPADPPDHAASVQWPGTGEVSITVEL